MGKALPMRTGTAVRTIAERSCSKAAKKSYMFEATFEKVSLQVLSQRDTLVTM